MKSIVVEGQSDYIVMETLFPEMARYNVTLRVALGFSNVFAVAKSLIDHGIDVLAVLDTDTNIPGNDNREIMTRIQKLGVAGRIINIVWMDSCLEDVLRKGNITIIDKSRSGGEKLRQEVLKNKSALLRLDEFRKIQEFINE
jgi:hypothetical protein